MKATICSDKSKNKGSIILLSGGARVVSWGEGKKWLRPSAQLNILCILVGNPGVNVDLDDLDWAARHGAFKLPARAIRPNRNRWLYAGDEPLTEGFKNAATGDLDEQMERGIAVLGDEAHALKALYGGHVHGVETPVAGDVCDPQTILAIDLRRKQLKWMAEKASRSGEAVPAAVTDELSALKHFRGQYSKGIGDSLTLRPFLSERKERQAQRSRMLVRRVIDAMESTLPQTAAYFNETIKRTRTSFIYEPAPGSNWGVIGLSRACHPSGGPGVTAESEPSDAPWTPPREWGVRPGPEGHDEDDGRQMAL